MMKAEEALALANKYTDTHGGGGGTSDYPDLTHKPQINGVTLVGNKTSADLGLMPEYEVDTTPTESSDNLITSGGVWNADKNINDKLQGSKTVEGNPITITDAEPMNAESVVVELEPKQDLHGYDKPWVGGAGKNKLPLTVDGLKAINTSGGTWSGNTYSQNGVTFEILTDSADNVLGIKVNGTASATTVFYIKSRFAGTIDAGNYILSKSYDGDIYLIEDAYSDNTWVKTIATSYLTDEVQSNIDYDGYNSLEIFLRVTGGISINATIYPMIRLSTETDPTFEPYSNICPISGYSEVNVEQTDDAEDPTVTNTYTIDLDGTRYGGTLDVTEGGYSDEYIRFEFDGDEGWVQTEDNQCAFSVYVHEFNDMIDAWGVDTPNIYCNQCKNDNEAAYWGYGSCFAKNGYSFYVSNSNCETLSEFITWLSNNPLIVVGKRKTPSSVSTTPTDIALLENTNNISTDGTNITLKYQPNNVIGECKTYTDEKCAKVLPQPPTIDGTYHLECSVSGGIPTIRWVSNS